MFKLKFDKNMIATFSSDLQHGIVNKKRASGFKYISKDRNRFMIQIKSIDDMFTTFTFATAQEAHDHVMELLKKWLSTLLQTNTVSGYHYGISSKRPRGRPRKNSVADPIDIPFKRPRGRPRKNTVTDSTDIYSKRPRGRPRKNTL